MEGSRGFLGTVLGPEFHPPPPPSAPSRLSARLSPPSIVARPLRRRPSPHGPHRGPGHAGGGEAGTEGEDDGFGEAGYAAINSMLDQINSCLDDLEEKDEHLHARLQELLESNRQTHLEFQ
nr:UPF0184 protein C9orf16 homolog [Globicephala melas]